MTRLRMPCITASDAGEQVRQIAAYLRYLAQTLNEVLDELEKAGGEAL